MRNEAPWLVRRGCAGPDATADGGAASRAVARRDGRPRTAGQDPIPVLAEPLVYAGLELQPSTGLVRLHRPATAVVLSGQQAAVLAVLIAARGEPRCRVTIDADLPRGCRPPTLRQIGVVISQIRHRIGAARILTGADGWWLHDPGGAVSEGPDILTYGDLRLDPTRRYVWFVGRSEGVRLGPQESDVLRMLVGAEGRPCAAHTIWKALAPERRTSSARTVGVVIHHLRGRIGRERIRTGGGGWWLVEPAAPLPGTTTWAGLWLNRSTHEVWLTGRDTSVSLSPQEAAVLRILLAARGEPRSARRLRDEMPARTRPRDPAAISTLISRLRRKLGAERMVTGGAGWWLTDPNGSLEG